MIKIKNSNLSAMIEKTFKNLLANKSIFFMMSVYPVLAIVFLIMFKPDKSIESINSFYVMNITMIPILVMSSLISEEKEKGIIKYLIILGVSSLEYLIGTIFSVFIFVIVSSMVFSVFILANKIYGNMMYLFFSILGAIPSTLLGCIIGITTNSQVEVGAKAAPVAMIIGMSLCLGGKSLFFYNYCYFKHINSVNNFHK